MNLFRCEEHVGRWLAGRPAGVTVPGMTLSRLALAGWGARLSPEWVPHSRQENQEILAGLGLTGDFWELPK